jgi:hypothetical protein
VDRRFNPNAENLNFAVRGDALLVAEPWEYLANGKELMDGWMKAHGTAFGAKQAVNAGLPRDSATGGARRWQ